MGSNRRAEIQVCGDSWEVYTYPFGEGMRAFVRFDLGIATSDLPPGYDDARSVLVRITPGHCQANGLPTHQATAELKRVEDELLALLEQERVDCKLVGVMTYGAMRDFIFQIAAPMAFDANVDRYIGEYDGGYELEKRELDGWRFFNDKVRPGAIHWEWIHNRRVVDQLIKAGTDMSAPHVLEHVFVGPDAALVHIRDQLGTSHFKVVSHGRDGLVMRKSAVLDLDDVTGLTHSLRVFGRQTGAMYEGWGAAVVEK